ncbi:Pyrophosphatase [Candidatus Megaera venefica]|uniref:Pyrophosphatase n=1 Tax=Candidatus Megaera venefica TaxID=2055910 RepID=A0ABU5ND02_9RICK|nr:hypothetical protein [Candidatus Megaera venefica]MEA0971035.1 Pyrophosphatase [Candidatus Megaera venefica]
MNLKEAALHCEKAWSQFANKNHINRDDVFYLFKLQEELGELTRSFLELRGSEKPTLSESELKRKFEGDIVSVVGNALILAHQYNIDLEKVIPKKFPVQN